MRCQRLSLLEIPANDQVDRVSQSPGRYGTIQTNDTRWVSTVRCRKEWLVNPRQVVEEFVKLFNKGDAAAIAELYHEDAVNHQVTREPVQGRAAICGCSNETLPLLK